MLGTAPLRGTNNKNKCGFTHEFFCTRTEEGTSLKKCWRSHKALCRYDFKIFRRNPIYRKLKLQNNNIDLKEFFPEFKWFGVYLWKIKSWSCSRRQKRLNQEQLRKQEILEKVITTLQTIGDHGIKLGSKLPVVGPFMKVVGMEFPHWLIS